MARIPTDLTVRVADAAEVREILEDSRSAVEFREEAKRLLRTDSPDPFVLKDLEDLITLARKWMPMSYELGEDTIGLPIMRVLKEK